MCCRKSWLVSRCVWGAVLIGRAKSSPATTFRADSVLWVHTWQQAAHTSTLLRGTGSESACLAVQLKILACNVSGGELQGTIMVNGQLVHPKEFRNQSAVVWQSDVLLSSSTVGILPCMPLSLQCNMQHA